MNILVLSDSHGNIDTLEKILAENKNCETIIFLGDGIYDLANAKDFVPYRAKIIVKGNCDRFADTVELNASINLEGVRFYVTHGFKEGVKTGLGILENKAAMENCNAALFGHTHIAHLSRPENIVLMNPGSSFDGFYAIIELNNEYTHYILKNINFPGSQIKELTVKNT